MNAPARAKSGCIKEIKMAVIAGQKINVPNEIFESKLSMRNSNSSVPNSKIDKLFQFIINKAMRKLPSRGPLIREFRASKISFN